MCGLLFYPKQQNSSVEACTKALATIVHRGPDDTELEVNSLGVLGFNRLAIMDLTHQGDQPFVHDKISVLCNGEIYNSDELRQEVTYPFHSRSDCEVLLPLYQKHGIEGMVTKLDGEFAFVIVDENSKLVFAARDPMGIRPLFYGQSKENGAIAFASEVKALQNLCSDIKAFPPGHYYKNAKFICYKDLTAVTQVLNPSMEEIYQQINKRLTSAVVKRMHCDAPLGYLLSGGLDSSLVCAIAQEHSSVPIRTFAVGMEDDAIDLKYAKTVAEHLGTDHTEVMMSKEDVLAALKDVIYSLESFDITTVRASLGMYLICQYIGNQTDIKALMTGEVSDELFGYKYTDYAPNPEEFQLEAAKRVKELYQYDVLRADRCLSAHSLEARVPFSDNSFVEYVMSLDPKIKMNSYGQGKFLLRKAFEGDLLPDSILYREKAAFSDAVGHSMVDEIKLHAESLYTDSELSTKAKKFKEIPPISKESLLYREIFHAHFPELKTPIPAYWMPNQTWKNCDVKDPSARVLPNYGESAK